MNIEHLKGTIKALSEKLKIIESVENEKKIIEESLKQSDQARSDLRSNIKENAEKIKEEKDKNINFQQSLISENQNLSKQIIEVTEMFTKKVQENDTSKFDLQMKEKDLNTFILKSDNFKDYKDKYERDSMTL